MARARLEELYNAEIRSQLQKDLGLKNIMEVPKVSKIVVNVGVKDAVKDSKVLKDVVDVISRITGQLPIKTEAKKSIAGFKLREGMPIGVCVTLRKQMMYEFLDRLINIALPEVRDFQGVGNKFDGRGNYNLGIKEWSIFPEVDFSVGDKICGLNITIQTSAKNDAHGHELLKKFGMPFKK
ncbi:MAG: 50S ribosomal protein L5 [uncultured bacterium]|jgi:large subunit ribosomal protein L5|nr:MAG: 50S ribosomal protein L5 [uncultured bacterium]KKP29588.1 MAG: 50S ribosomal protein L5 [candidate division TM6 bacterium GW2011_GWF2_30_66]